ncbi:MAG: GNAT family N-acetyltransferase [Bacteroidota bacterium]|nr:GNAT family N-acetyltransferase [Bacteroidota bacterium]
MLKNPFLTGEKIYLSPLTKEDISQGYVSWLNDAEVCRHNSHATFPNTVTKTLSYLQSIEKSKTEIVFAIRWKKNNEHIGNISFKNLNWVSRSGEIAILIGEKNYWSKGVGSEAFKLLIEYGFNSLNLNRISSGLMTTNNGMIKICEKNRMKMEGLMREFLYKEGRYLDALIYSILLKDYKGEK